MPKEIDVGANLAPIIRPGRAPSSDEDPPSATAPAAAPGASRTQPRTRKQPAGKKTGSATNSPSARRSGPGKQR
ncbi:MAG: hypothetical protein L0I76_23135, partial [Pseudonocardia sp.]|nr:hypothetical protein [Pseudonocardia sp.]